MFVEREISQFPTDEYIILDIIVNLSIGDQRT